MSRQQNVIAVRSGCCRSEINSPPFFLVELDALPELAEIDIFKSCPVLLLNIWAQFGGVSSRLSESEEQRHEQDELRHRLLGAVVHQTQREADQRKR